jgi:hypothetical protein
MTNTETLARTAYDAYCVSVGGKAFNGDNLPPFSDVPAHIQAAWITSVSAVVQRLEDDHGVSLVDDAR